MRNLTLTIHFCDISQSFVSATKYENTSKVHSKIIWTVKIKIAVVRLVKSLVIFILPGWYL
jgi:hypothetical protein